VVHCHAVLACAVVAVGREAPQRFWLGGGGDARVGRGLQPLGHGIAVFFLVDLLLQLLAVLLKGGLHDLQERGRGNETIGGEGGGGGGGKGGRAKGGKGEREKERKREGEKERKRERENGKERKGETEKGRKRKRKEEKEREGESEMESETERKRWRRGGYQIRDKRSCWEEGGGDRCAQTVQILHKHGWE
jgi:hypothetical protein